jgi:hypothetical protein
MVTVERSDVVLNEEERQEEWSTIAKSALRL